jgi:CRP/FNR family transcriptional regulator, cyclic AMP receptor protein
MDTLEAVEAADQTNKEVRASSPSAEHGLDADEILKACASVQTVRLKSGEFLFREGDEARCFYVVKRGTVRIVSGGTLYETVRRGGIVGEMAMIDPGVPRSANVIAGTLAELAAIDVDNFLSLVVDTPRFALTIMRVLTRRLRVMNQRYRAER